MKQRVFQLLILGMILPSLLFSQTRRNERQLNRQRDQRNVRVMSVLDEKQKDEWRKIRIDYQKKKNDLIARLKNARLDLQELMRTGREPDEQAIYKKLREISDYTYEQKRLSVEEQIRFRKLLTEEQWQKIQELKGDRRLDLPIRKARKRNRSSIRSLQ